MFKSRYSVVFLIFCLWFSLTAARPPAPSAAPGDFSKLTPASGVVNQSTSPTLTWEASPGAINYQYCIRTNQNCSNKWFSVGNVTSITVSNLAANTLYYWQVRATDATGVWTYANTDSSDRWTLRTQAAPGAFNKISPSDGATGQAVSGLSLTWGASSGATDYQYCIDQTNGITCDTIWQSAGNATTTTISSLAANTVYYWQVRATNSAGTTEANATVWWSFSTFAAPGPFNKTSPADTALNQPVSSLALTWEESSGAASYEYCYDTSNNNTCDTSWTANGSETSALIDNLAYDTLYYWQVRAVNPGGLTEATGGAWWSFNTSITPPGAFGKASPLDGTADMVNNPTLSWGPSSNATGYEVCIYAIDESPCADGDWQGTGTGTSVSFSLAYGKTYTWQVRAENSSGAILADNGTWWTFSIMTAPPLNFSKINPINGAANQLLDPFLYWSTSQNATGYRYCFDTSNNNTCDTSWTAVSASITSAQIMDLLRDTTYYWQVEATGSAYESANDGTWWSFTTLPPVVTVDPTQLLFTTPEDVLFSGQLHANNPKGLPLSFWLVDPQPAGLLALNIDGSFSYQPVVDFNGELPFYFMASDGVNAAQGPFTATINVTAVNDAPVLAVIADKVVKTGQHMSFTAAATDADLPYGDMLTFSIVEPLPAGAVFASGVFSWTPKWTFLHPQPYTFTVVVSDDRSPVPSTDQQVVTISVLPEVVLLPAIFR